VETLFTGEKPAEHLGALRRLLVAPERRPAALLVMAVRDHGLDGVVREAAAAGIHFVFLNAVEDDLGAVRREFPAVSVVTVCPDEVETGRVQGRQMRALVPAGAACSTSRATAQPRFARAHGGMEEATAGAPFEVVLAGGDWSPAFAGRTVREWLRFAVGGRRPYRPRLLPERPHGGWRPRGARRRGRGVRKARDRAHPRGRLRRSPGDRAEDGARGRLVATVVLPRVAGPAVEEVAALLARSVRPAPVIAHAAASFPPLDELTPIA